MAAQKKVNKKKLQTSRNKHSSLKSSNAAVSVHKKATEKMIITGILSILIIGLIVWFSQDFPAEGHAYQIGLELEHQEGIAIATLSSCQESCDYTLSVAEALGNAELAINGNPVDPYQVVYYNNLGVELTVSVSSLNFVSDGVETVGYLGNRYPVETLTIG